MLHRLVLAALALSACDDRTPPSMDFARISFYDAPFPSDDLRRSDGTIDISRLPTSGITILDQAKAVLDGTRGFGLASTIYFKMGSAIDPTTLPDLAGSVDGSPSVMLVAVDPMQPNYGQRHPIDVAFIADGGPVGDANLLAILPLQGVPLRPNTRYAALITTAVHDAQGRPITPAPAMSRLSTDYQAALAAAAPALPVAAMTVFTTGDPSAPLGQARDDAFVAHPIAPPTSATLTDTFTDYCVYQTTVSVPDFQAGTPPYTDGTPGGAWAYDASGHLVFDHNEVATVYITIPRAPMPATGWPTVLFVRTGGGGDRPLVDRSPVTTPNGSPPPGFGPAMHFAQIGFAGVQVDGPLGGLRNTTHGNEDFLIFNVQNPAALRDNIRESAIELSLVARMLPSLTVNTPDCPGTSGTQRIDSAHLVLMGHSMGSWIAPLTLSIEPTLRAGIFSGAGASYIDNIIDKQSPVAVRPFAEILLGYVNIPRTLERHDPALMLVEWAAEPSDPQVYGDNIAPTNVLMLQGIVDHYILPSIANSTSLAMHLNEGGPTYDATNAELAGLGQPTLAPLLRFSGAQTIALPANGSAVVQHPADGILDGHEVVFQSAAPQHQYRCFLSSFLSGMPRVSSDGAVGAPCD
jgi:hypothetical protein